MSNRDDERELDIRLLGPVRALHRGRALNLGGMQARSVLAVLLLNAGQIVPSSVILERAWRQPPDDVEAGKRRITDYVSDLRAALKPVQALIRLVADQPGYRVELNPKVVVDARDFRRLLEQGRTALDSDEDLAVRCLTRALSLWPDDGLALADLDATWLRRQGEILQDQRLDAHAELATLHIKAGHPAAAATLLRDIVPANPGRQVLTVLLVEALTAADEPVQAADAAARAVTTIRSLGLEPSRALRDAHTNALNRRPPLRPGEPARPGNRLPADLRVFAGRDHELDHLLGLADNAQPLRATVISAIDGMAGIGKTALAVRASHRLAGRFPDGALFADLHGYTQNVTPTTPDIALHGFLLALGVPPKQIPDDMDARAALYRQRLAGTRTLILLDNVNSEAHVRPLLPGAPGCLVLITSRKRLRGLEDTDVVALDVLPISDATSLLYEVVGPRRIRADDPLLEEIAELCGRLPLALRIVAALLRHRRSWTLASLADRLHEILPRLDGFSDGERTLSVMFDLSYRELDDDQKLLYRRLGLAPGPSADAYAAAALLDIDPTTAERALQDLVDYNLLAEPLRGRYQLHDLVRSHAHTLAAAEPADRHNAAIERMMNYYQYTASMAAMSIARYTPREPTCPTPAYVPTFEDAGGAEAWLRIERPNLEAGFDYADGLNRDKHVIGLGASLADILRIDGPWTRAQSIHTAAAAAAIRLNDTLGQANALAGLGEARGLTDDYPGAVRDFQNALYLYRSIGDRLGQATVLAYLSQVRRLTGDYSAAIQDLQKALELYRELEDQLGQAVAHSRLGAIRGLTGDFPGAVRNQQKALELYRNAGDRLGLAVAYAYLGDLRRLTGDYAEAVQDLQRALELNRELGDRLGQAHALTFLGEVRRLTGDYSSAIQDHQAALDLHNELGNRNGKAHTQTFLGKAYRDVGDYARAMQYLKQALELYRETGARGNEAWTLTQYAAVHAAAGDISKALELYGEALRLTREVNHPDDEALALEGIGECLVRFSDIRGGATHMTQALKIFQRLGMQADANRVRVRLAEFQIGDQQATG